MGGVDAPTALRNKKTGERLAHISKITTHHLKKRIISFIFVYKLFILCKTIRITVHMLLIIFVEYVNNVSHIKKEDRGNMNKNIKIFIIALLLLITFAQAKAQSDPVGFNNEHIRPPWESHNQNEAARAFIKMAAKRNSADTDFWNTFNTFAQDGDLNKMAQQLDSISGQFLAQTITRMAVENPGKSIYPHIKRNKVSWLDNNKLGERQLYFHALWVDPFIREAVIDRPKNRLGELSDSRFGARGGLSLVEDTRKTFGIFWAADKTRIRQGQNSANIDSFEVGGYAGLFRGKYDHRFFVSGSRHNVETERFIDLDEPYRPEASFHLLGFKYGFESSVELNYYIPKTTPLFFVGAYNAFIHNPKIQEKGGDVMNLTIESHRYERLAGYWGIRLEGDWWYADGRVNYFIKGKNRESRFDAHFIGNRNYRMGIEGSNDDLVSFELKAGIEREVEKDIFFYAALGGEISRNFYEKSFELKGGIKYMFADRYSAPFYKAFMRRINPEKRSIDKERRLERARLRREIEKAARERSIEREVSEFERKLELKRIADEARETEKEMNLLSAQERDIKATQKTEQDRMIIEAQEKQLKAAQERRRRAMDTYNFKAGFFQADSAVLLPHAMGNIKTLAANIKDKRYRMITVEGHSDPTGNEDVSMDLSIQRARAIYNELIKNGLPANKITLIGFGDRMPIADNGTEEGRAANRRVEIFIE
jgi:outer membrane protein OmpA-like peptidoglycan-associated protein